MKKLFNFNRKHFSFKKEDFLSDDEKDIIEESTIVEAEKILEKLKEEEQKARNAMVKELKDVFKELPVLL